MGIDARKRSRRALKTQRGVAGKDWAEIQAMKTSSQRSEKPLEMPLSRPLRKRRRPRLTRRSRPAKPQLARRRRPTSRRTPNRVARVLNVSVARGKHLSTNAVFVRLFYLCYDRSTLN